MADLEPGSAPWLLGTVLNEASLDHPWEWYVRCSLPHDDGEIEHCLADVLPDHADVPAFIFCALVEDVPRPKHGALIYGRSEIMAGDKYKQVYCRLRPEFGAVILRAVLSRNIQEAFAAAYQDRLPRGGEGVPLLHSGDNLQLDSEKCSLGSVQFLEDMA